jgi:hypothetical protein
MYRTWTTAVLSALMVAMPLRAEDGPNKEATDKKDAAAAAAAKTAPAARGKTAEKEAEKPTTTAIGAEIEQLRQMVLEQARQMEMQQQLMREQQEKLKALAEELRAARSAPESRPGQDGQERSSDMKVIEGQLEAVADATNEVTKKVAALDKDYTAEKKSLGDKIKAIGPFTFSGDLRARYEPFFGGGAQTFAAPEDRHRQRFRLRFNANAKFNDEISGGFSLASGDVGDPISTNQTESGFLTRKPITIDRAFITYHPKYFKPFTVTAGKYAYPWHRTELTWDNDLNPEGITEQVMWNWKDKFLSHFGVVAFQTPVFEVSGGPDSGIFGGQVQMGWKLGSRVKLGADVAYYDFRNPDRIAQNQNNGNGFASNGTPTGLGGTFAFGGSANSNNVGTIAGTRFFVSKFGIVDALLRADVDTGSARWPAYFLVNFAQNTRACSNREIFDAAGVTVACDPHQRHAYWAETSFGRTSEKGDFRFAYTFMRIERDAVVAAFNFSDLRQATNDVNHRVEVYYQAYKNVTLGFTGLIGRQLVTAQSLTPERWLKRLQFDAVYKF